MLEAANAAVPRISVARAKEMMASESAIVIDVRDTQEVERSGKIAGALHVPRGMLEFRADPEMPSYDSSFDNGKAIIVYCASGARAALSGMLLKDLGYTEVYNLGSFKDWTDNNGSIETAERRR
jgi:rhodanese-related sulfurtransferase